MTFGLTCQEWNAFQAFQAFQGVSNLEEQGVHGEAEPSTARQRDSRYVQ